MLAKMSSREASDGGGGGVEVVDSVAPEASNGTSPGEADDSDGTLGSADSQEDFMVTDEPSTPAKSHPPKKKERTPCGFRGCASRNHLPPTCPMV